MINQSQVLALIVRTALLFLFLNGGLNYECRCIPSFLPSESRNEAPLDFGVEV
jgi:hypothetical protein